MIQRNEMTETLRDVAERLNSLGIAYMVTGSFAMSSYSTARLTMDIDVVLEIKPADSERLAACFAGDYYVNPASVKRAIEQRSMFNLVSNITGVKVDCIVKKSDKLETERFGRRRRSSIDGVEFWVIAKQDLIISKLKWARESLSEQQFRDIRGLIESGVDDETLMASIAEDGLNETWASFEQWKIRAAK